MNLFKKKPISDNNLYIITVIFNPNAYESRYKLYRQFKPYIEQSGAKLITVEIAYGDKPFVVTSSKSKWDVQLRTTDEMWHKEAGINVGFQYLLKIAPNANYMGWFDADIKFTNPNWVEDVKSSLQKYEVVQPFSEAINLSPKYERMWSCPSAIKHYHDKLGYHQHPPIPKSYLCGGHPGLAWCARVGTFKWLGGLMDFCVAGSGDTHMFNALIGDVTLFYRPGMTKQFQDALKKWGDRALLIHQNIGYVNGICYHYWHGKSEKRGYEKRWDIICFHQFDPYQDIVRARNGLYKWVGGNQQLIQDLRRSMNERDEDSTTI